jgi:hypothetical protein
LQPNRLRRRAPAPVSFGRSRLQGSHPSRRHLPQTAVSGGKLPHLDYNSEGRLCRARPIELLRNDKPEFFLNLPILLI